jgi:hypothetical protein
MDEEETVRTLYTEAAALPLNRQKAFLAELPDEVRANLWAFHLAKFLETHHELNAAQRAVITEGIDLLNTPRFLTGPNRSPEHRERLEEHKARAIALFSPTTIHALFFKLGEA